MMHILHKELWVNKKKTSGSTGPVKILEHSCSHFFTSRMSPNVFEINEDKINENKCQ